jgi:hypothetical protein
MGRILPRPSGTALAQLACATCARPMAWLAQPYVVACAHSRTWPGACAVVAAALAMAARLIHGQRAPPMTRGLTKSTTRRRERRGAHFGVSPPQARTETVDHRGFGGGNARKPVWRRRARMQLLPGSGDLHVEENSMRTAVNTSERMAMVLAAGRSGPYR